MTDNKPLNQPVWTIESTHPDLLEPFKSAMRQIKDPELGFDIIQLGLLRDVSIEDDSVRITMLLTTPFCPYGPALIDTTRAKAEEFFKMPVFISLGMEMWDFSMMEEGSMPDWGLY